MFGFLVGLLMGGRDRAASRQAPESDRERTVAREAPLDELEVNVIQTCRQCLGPHPRDLGDAGREAFRLELNPILASTFQQTNDPLLRIIEDQAALRDRGRVVWGHIVQANSLLFDPANRMTLAANVVYSPDPYFDGRVSLLADIAHGLFAQKGTTPADRDLREFVRVITDERERVLRRELPRRYCEGRSVYFATCLIQPGHLPGNCLTQSAFPLLINPAETRLVMVLPARFWPARLIARWQADAPAGAPPPARKPQLTLTPAAAEQAGLVFREHGARYLRVAVVVEETRSGVPTSVRLTVAAEMAKRVDDVVIESEGVEILLDALSAMCFEEQGQILDWTTEGGRQGFKFVPVGDP